MTRRAISLIEVMIILAILSLFVLPGFMLMKEYSRGGNTISERYEILSFLEERLETALALPFADIPEGVKSDVIIDGGNGLKLDLKPIVVAGKVITFECKTEILNLDFSAYRDYDSRQIKSITLENGMKRITITARWGKGTYIQDLSLTSYKADL